MKILLVNKFLYPKGGSETYVLKLGELLTQHGHDVQYFGMEDEKNTVSNCAGVHVSAIDFGTGIRRNLNAPFRILYSAEARRKIRSVLQDFQPDIVHLNNIHFQLTPSIILEIHAYRRQTGKDVRIVYTAHDYQLVCPNHSMLDSKMQVCEKCLGGNYFNCVLNKCVKSSFAKSILGAAEAYLWTFKEAYAYIDTIICCSRFLKGKLDAQERFREKTITIHNFADGIPGKRVVKEGYVLQFGRLNRDKGIYTALEAAKRMPEVRFVFAGRGEAEDDIKGMANVEYVGFKSGEELEMLVRKAAVCLCPSECYENCPFSVIESQMYGTPVIGSRIGGIPELIEEGVTGELFEAGNTDELEEKLREVLFTPGLAEAYSENCAKHLFETSDSYYEKLMAVYQGRM